MRRLSKIINAFDIETKIINGIYIPFCLVYSYKTNYYSFYGENVIGECLEHMKEKLKKNYIHVFYIHNINFDGLLLIEYLSKYNYHIELMGFNANIYYLRLHIDEICVEWRCSYKLVPLPLSTIGAQWINMEKLPFPYKILTRNFENNELIAKDEFNNEEEFNRWKSLGCMNISVKEYTIKYCEQDVKITKKFVEKFWEVINTFSISKNSQIYSLPSFSVRIFFKHFNSLNISKTLDNTIDKYVRQSYYGGRCEVFGNPSKSDKIFHFDFKGMYAQCMQQNFPTSKPYLTFDIKTIEKPGFYNIDWEFYSNLPILPMKDDSTSKLMFYAGNGSGIYWYEEIVLMLENGGKVKKIYSALIYEELGTVFLEYVNQTNEIRAKGGVYKDIGKLLINSIYGRLGMGRENTKTIISYEENISENMIKFSKINNIIIGEVLEYKEFEGISNVVMASIITSKARIKLYKGFLDVQKEGGRILYCDTDSIVAAFKRDVSNETHGEVFWDITKQDTVIEKACFALPKTYSLVFKNGWTTKIKGIKRNRISFNKFYNSFIKGEEIIDREFININKKSYRLTFNHSIKKINLLTSSKRKWCNKKIYTKPFIML
jgi:hypothetical protein